MNSSDRGTHKHDSLGNVVRLHEGILVQPQLLWLDHSLERLQEFSEAAAQDIQTNSGQCVGNTDRFDNTFHKAASLRSILATAKH